MTLKMIPPDENMPQNHLAVLRDFPISSHRCSEARRKMSPSEC